MKDINKEYIENLKNRISYAKVDAGLQRRDIDAKLLTECSECLTVLQRHIDKKDRRNK